MTISHKRLGLLFILVGPTGAGKNTLMNGVLDDLDDLLQLPTATTRPIRPNETEGREHHFVAHDEFLRMIDNNELLEWQNVHGKLYGVPRRTVEDAITQEHDRIADVDVLGAMLVRSLYPDNTILIFVQPGEGSTISATTETVRERLEQRGESKEEIENRLPRVKMEMNYAPYCDYLIINEDKDDAIHTLLSIILAERSRRNMVNLRVVRGLPRRRLVFTAASIITQGEQVIVKEGNIPTQRLLNGEHPDDTAARTLQDVLPASITMLQPLDMTSTAGAFSDEICFWYHTSQSDIPSLPDSWSLIPLEQVTLPEKIRATMELTLYQQLDGGQPSS